MLNLICLPCFPSFRKRRLLRLFLRHFFHFFSRFGPNLELKFCYKKLSINLLSRSIFGYFIVFFTLQVWGYRACRGEGGCLKYIPPLGIARQKSYDDGAWGRGQREGGSGGRVRRGYSTGTKVCVRDFHTCRVTRVKSTFPSVPNFPYPLSPISLGHFN